jgi:hypothetical protein
MPPGIRPSILRSTAFYILFIELPKYQFSDPYQKFIHRSIHRTLQMINPSKHFFRTSIHQTIQKTLSINRTISTINSAIHLGPSIQKTIHPSIQKTIHPSIQKTIHPSSQRTSHRSIQKPHSSIHTDDSFILIMIRPTRLPIQSTDEPSAVQSQITFEESTDTKLSWIILYFITQKNVTISDRTCQTCNAFILWIGSYVIFSAPWCCPCI